MIRREALFLLAVMSPGGLAAQQREVRGARAAPDVAIRLWAPAGFVEVIAWDRDSVEVAATSNPGSRFGGGGTAEAMKFSFELARGSDTALAGGQLRVRVPRGARVWIKSTLASVHLDGVHGEVEVTTVAGGTQVRNGRGVVRVEAIDGAVTLERVTGAITVRGGSGAVQLHDLGGTVDISAIGGEVRLMGLAIPMSGRIETVSGHVLLFGNLAGESRLDVSTHGGTIGLALAGDRPVRIEGSVPGSEIPPVHRDAPAANGVITVHSFKGRLNVGRLAGISGSE